MRSATIYQTKDKLILCSKAKTVEGVGLSIPPYIHLSNDASDEQIVAAIGEVIGANQFNILHPKQYEWGEIGKKHLSSLGIRSMSEMHKKVTFCLIEEIGTDLLFTPSKKEGTNGGFLYVTEMAIRISQTSPPKDIARALRTTLYTSLAMNTR